ncbi:MAG: right-handed parallel beta-helix repeat-containing protein [Planctomycetes bacterium]|nr:right-handed parallel beta-helix repeat-containing protein [Planctomycetota bacterium]
MKKIAIITILVCVLCSRCVRAEVLMVPTFDYPLIQDAIDVAVDGDTIIVKAGIYSGFRNVDLDFKGKAITLTSSDPEDPDVVAGTVIDCEGSSGDPHRGFLFWKGEGSDSVLNGFTIRNGYHNFGGGIQINNSSPTILNCTIELNTSTDQGGGIYLLNSQAVILKCRILNNRALDFDGGGIACINSDPNIVECEIAGNVAAELGGGIFLNTSDAFISRCRITGNRSGVFGGGMFSLQSAPLLVNCLLAGNLAESSGGGVFLQDSAPGSAFKLVHCTISENRAKTHGGAIRCSIEGRVEVINCILWGNRAAFGAEIALIDTSEIILSYSNVQGGLDAIDKEDGSIVTPGEGVIDSDPLFVGAGSWDEGILLNDISDDVWTMGDYHLQEGSPSRNTGDNGAAAELSTDLDGSSRLMGNRVDMGAYEIGPDLMVVSWEVLLPEGPLVPGDKGKVSLVIRNTGGESVNSRMALGIYASANRSLDEEDILIVKASNQRVRLAAGSSRTYRIRIVLPAELQPGDYYFGAKVDADDEIIETDESDLSNVIFSSGSRSVVWQFGTVGVRRNVALTVVDPGDRAVIFRLGGDGFGEIKPDFSQLDLTGTTLKSSLRITTRGRGSETTLGGIQVAGGGSLKAIMAKTTNIAGGGIEIPAGTVSKILLKDINESVIIIGDAADSQAAVSIQLGRVSNLKILSGTPIKSLTVVEWLDDEMDDVIDTARLGRLLVKGNKKATPVIEGDFEADLILRGIPNETKAVLGQAIISGRIRNAFWEITGSVGVIIASGFDNSLLLVGVNETIDDIADFAFGPGDFIQEQYEIRSVILRGAPDELFVNDSNYIELIRTELIRVSGYVMSVLQNT